MAIDRERTLAAAQKYVEKKRYDRAAAEYQRILQEDPNDARILLKLGDLQSKMETYADAVASYDRVGQLYAKQGFALKAIAVFKQIREIIAKHVPQLDERYAHVVPKLADLYQQLGLTSDALAALDEVATRLQRQNREAEAIEVFRRLVELDPTNPLPHLRLAEALSRAKDVDGAVDEFGTAAEQLSKLGRRDDALKVLERLLHHRPDPARARLAAELYLSRGAANDGMQALAKLQLGFQADPRNLDTLGLLARAFMQIGQAAKAVEVQKEMARVARDLGQADVHAEIVGRLMKIAPSDPGVRELAAGIGLGDAPSVRPEAASASYEDVGDSDIEPSEVPSAQPMDLAARPGGYAEFDDQYEEATTASGSPGQVTTFMAQAATLRQARRFTDAIRTLEQGLRASPRSIELHQMWRDVLLDADRTHEAVDVMVRLAELLVESLDGEAAARELQDALALEPDNEAAARMLSDLGYELVEEPTSIAGQEQEDAADLEPPSRGRRPSQDPDAPLPSYDLEEIGPDDVSVRSYPEGGLPPPPQPAESSTTIEGMDDPFSDSPLPSFPLDQDRGLESGDRVGPPPSEAPRSTSKSIPELESALEEVDFFTSRGLFEDARTILEEQLARLPNHPLLRDRLAELDAHERSLRGGSGTRPSPAATDAFDIAESLSALEAAAPVAPQPVGVPAGQSVDVEEVFAQFKAGVATQIGADDAQSHYDIGVAYKEMGLLDDAIREFEVAARDTQHSCICLSMIGTIEVERGRLNEAIDAFTRGLQAPDRTKDQEAALAYELGAAYETKKVNKQALELFQRTARINPSFRDVQERIRRLQRPDKPQGARAVAVGADDEFDRAFDDILSGKS